MGASVMRPPPGFELMQPPPGFEMVEEPEQPPLPEGFEMVPPPEGFQVMQSEPVRPPPSARMAAIPVEEDEEKPSWNKLRGIGERAATLGGNLLRMGQRGVDQLRETFADLPTEITWGGPEGLKVMSPNQIKQMEEETGQSYTELRMLGAAADAWREADLGYEEHQGWEQGKQALFDPDASFMDKARGVGDIVSWGFETGLVSLPDMVGVLTAMPAYLASRTNEIAEERAEADGRDPETLTASDLAVGGGTAVAVALLERFGAQRLLNIRNAKGSIVKGIAQGAGVEALTESQQELAEYLGAQLGTEKGVSFLEGLERTLQGTIAGGSFGGPAGGVSAGVGKIQQAGTDRRQMGQTQPGVDQTTDLDDAPAQAELTPEEQVRIQEEQMWQARAAEVAQNRGGAEVAAARQAIPTTEPAPAPTETEQTTPVEQAAPAEVAALKPMEPDQAAIDAAQQIEDTVAGTELEPETQRPMPQAAGMQFIGAEGTPAPAPALAQTIEAFNLPLQEYQQVAAQATGGRPNVATGEQLTAVDSAWQYLASQVDTLNAAGYDTKGLIKALKRAAGTQSLRGKVIQNRGAQPVTGRIKGGDIAPLGGRSKNTPRGGWGKVADEFFTDAYKALNDLLQAGPVKAPQGGIQLPAAKAAPVPAPVEQAAPQQPVTEIPIPDTTIPSRRREPLDTDTLVASLPPVPEGYTRLYRASSPTQRFTDVFDPEALRDFAPPEGATGQFYTDDLSVADYYRDALNENSDASITYTDVPNDVLATAGTQMRDGILLDLDAINTGQTAQSAVSPEPVAEPVAAEPALTPEQQQVQEAEQAGYVLTPEERAQIEARNAALEQAQRPQPKEGMTQAEAEAQAQAAQQPTKKVSEVKLATKKRRVAPKGEALKTKAAERRKGKITLKPKKPAPKAMELKEKAAAKKAPPKPVAKKPLPKQAPKKPDTEFASPVVRKAAEAQGLTAAEIKPTGRGGKRTKKDVERARVNREIRQGEAELKQAMTPKPQRRDTNTGGPELRLTDKPAMRTAWEGQKLDQQNMIGGQDIFSGNPQAVVSPANSFGAMNGGIDLVYMKKFGDQIESRVIREIESRYGGEMPIGAAFVIRTYPEGQPIPKGQPEYLVVSPTMVRPGVLKDASSVYRATLAALKAADEAGIQNMNMPGMGTGVGKLAPRKAADAMTQAIEDFMAVKDGTLTYEQAINDYIGSETRTLQDVTPASDIDRVKANLYRDLNKLRAEGVEMNEDMMFMFHGTSKANAEPVVAAPRMTPTQYGTSGVFAASDMDNVIDWAARKFGQDNVGVGMWAFTKADFDRLVKQGEIRKGRMSVAESTKNYSDTEQTFDEFVLSEKALGFIYDQRAYRDQTNGQATEAAAVSQLNEDLREDVIDARETAATMMEQTMEVDVPVNSGDLLRDIKAMLDVADPYQALIDKLLPSAAGNIDVTMLNRMDMYDQTEGANGQYMSYTDELGNRQREIIINDLVVGDRHGVKVLLHELVHAATAEGTTTDNALAQQMESLRKRVQKHLQDVGDMDALDAYGFTNVDEFIAEAMTNADFQRILAGVPAENNKNLLHKFVEAISNFLGLNADQQTALAEAISIVPDLFMTEQQAIDAASVRRRGDYISNVTAEAEMAPATPSEMEKWLMDMPPRELMDRTRTVNTSKRLGNTAVGEITGRIYDVTGGRIDLREARRAGSRIGLGFHTLDQIVRRFKGQFEGALTKYDSVVRKKNQYAREQQQKAEQLNNKWRDYEKRTEEAETKVLGQFMHDATMSGIHADLPFNHPANAHLAKKKGAKEQHRLMQKRFNELPQGGRGIYRAAAKFFRNQRNDLRKSTIEHMARTWNLDSVLPAADYQQLLNAKSAEDIQAVDLRPLGDQEQRVQDSLSQVATLTSVEGPYFPLRRFGKYVVEGGKSGERVGKTHQKRNAAWKEARTMRSKDPTSRIRTRKADDGTYYNERVSRTVEMFDSITEADNRAAELTTEGYRGREGGDVRSSLKEEWNMPPGSNAGVLLSQAKQKFDQDSAQAKAIDTAFLELLLENSMRKSELQRKKVMGASFDMRRAFAERSYAGSWGIADIQTSLDHAQAVRDLSQQARGNVQLGEVVNEIKIRDEKSLGDRRISGVEAAISKFGFVNYLFSPSYTMVNMTQPWLVGAPYLNARYGARATAELAKAYRGVAAAGAAELARVKGGWDGAPVNALDAMMQQMNEGEREVVQSLTDEGIIDATFMQELYKTASGKGESAVVGKIMDLARTTPQVAEVLNRVTMARAAYNLEMRKSQNLTKALEAAREAVLQTQFDYTDNNKPRYFKAFPGARAIMMFKMYSQGMYALLASSTVQSFKGKTKQERRQAAKTLAGLVASHSLAGGVLGGVAMEPVRALFSIFEALFGDDDDPMVLDDMVEQALFELTGSAAATELITRGLSRAVGADLHGRVGLHNLAFMGMQDARSYQEAYKNTIVAAGGPIVAAGGNIMRGVDYLSRGEIRRGIEAASPKIVRDALKTWRIADEGMLDYNGNVIAGKQDFTTRDYIAQSIGFASATATRTFEGRTAQKSRETKLRDRRKKLMSQWRRKDPKERAQFYRNVIVPYNRKNPEFLIRPDQLFKSISEQRRREAQTSAGAFTEKQTIRRMGDAYGG